MQVLKVYKVFKVFKVSKVQSSKGAGGYMVKGLCLQGAQLFTHRYGWVRQMACVKHM
jgi:hypothetical protein